MKKVMVIVAHPDDEIIGVGGTIAKHVKNGDDVSVLILGDGKSSRNREYSTLDSNTKNLVFNETKAAMTILGIRKYDNLGLPDNRFDTVPLLDIIKNISDFVKKNNPSVVYTHHFGDLNIDHRITFEAVITATRTIEAPFVKEIYLFETLSSTEMSGSYSQRFFVPNTFIEIVDFLDQKIEAMEAYVSELREFPHPRSIETIKYNALLWGSKNNTSPLEAFFCFRRID
jgi:N-acetylglucosamine malate deacetylase 1